MFDLFGLDALTEAVYMCILKHRSWGVAEITRHLDATESEVRAALDNLADLRLLWPSQDQPGGFRAVRPEIGLAGLLANTEAQLLDQQQKIARARAAIAAVASDYQAGRGHEDTTAIRLEGLDAVRGRLEELAHEARTECLSFMPGGAQRPDTMAASQPLDQLALERGVAIKSVYQDSFRNDPATVRYAEWLTALGGETRSTPTLPMLLVIVDRQIVLAPLDPDDGRIGAVELRSPGVVAGLCALFDAVWDSATPFGRRTDRSAGLQPMELALLRLLVEGNTDEVAARRLGISPRTVRRTMSEVMARLDARSRFQAGARAVQEGWL